MKVTSAPSFKPIKADGTDIKGPPLLKNEGPTVVLGWTQDQLVIPNSPSASTLFGPRGAARLKDGTLWVADTGHHRLLAWQEGPDSDNQDADLVIGQPGFFAEGRNAKGPVTAATLNVPTGITAWGDGLAVADAWNHRVLLWFETPRTHNQPADLILGQLQADANLANQGQQNPTATSLHWPYGVSAFGDQLIVCDSGNRRVMIWDQPRSTGQPADLVLGQTKFTIRDENGGMAVGAAGMRWPHASTVWRGALAVADAGNNRIMLWQDRPTQNGQACQKVLGQKSFTACDHNLGAYYPSAAAVNMPYALGVCDERLLVADTANSRLIGWQNAETGADATWLTGQPDFASKGDNRWGMTMRDSLCWPYGLTCCAQQAIIADSGNNRVLLWELA